MNLITVIRKYQQSQRHVVLAGFAVFWLGAALQPCAMAMTPNSDVEIGDTAHQVNVDAVTHHDGHESHDRCIHCDSQNCTELGGGCDDPDALKRNAAEKDDSRTALSQALWMASEFVRTADRDPSPHVVDAWLIQAGPSIYVRHCAYLK